MNFVKDCSSESCSNQNKQDYGDLNIMLSLIPKDIPTQTQEQLNKQIRELYKKETNKNELAFYVNNLNSNSIVDLHYALTKSRKYISHHQNDQQLEQKIQYLIDLNIMKYLNRLIYQPNQYPIIMYEAAWLITNIVSGSRKQLNYVLNNDGLELLERVLKCESLYVKDQAVSALGNIAADSSEFRDIFFQKGIINQVLSNICRGKEKRKFEDICQSLDFFAFVIKKSESQITLQDACWSLVKMSHEGRGIQQIIKADIISKLIQLLQRNQISVPAMMIIRNILKFQFILQILINFYNTRIQDLQNQQWNQQDIQLLVIFNRFIELYIINNQLNNQLLFQIVNIHLVFKKNYLQFLQMHYKIVH